ncbi:MAG: protein kinase [Planctomycetota bacterium]
MPDRSDREFASAEALFDEVVRRRDCGEVVDIEDLCAAHPDLAAALRAYEAARRRTQWLLPGPLELAPEVSAPANAESRDTNEFLARLQARVSGSGRYRTLAEIARGGMGIVFAVRDTELQRELAMKVVRPRTEGPEAASPMADPRTVRRFLEEARITSQLDHPGIVPVHDIGVGDDGRPYFTMRRVQGETLGVVLDRARDGVDGWSQPRVVDVILKVCEAMSYAHAQGYLHRDLKPANVMVGRFGEVYVMDWGLARGQHRPDPHDLRLQAASASELSAPGSDASTDLPLLTVDGDALGTPAYMPPEQARGDVHRLGPPADVYAVGAMLYQAIAGEAPYVGKGERVAAQVVRERVVAGPPRALASRGEHAPAELVAICERAMARDLDQRYPSMQALAADLRAYLESRVVSAYRTGTWAETRMWVRRNRGLAASLGASVLVLLAAVAAVSLFWQRAARMQASESLRADVLAARAAVDSLRQQTQDPDFEPPPGETTFAWWCARVHELIDGLPDSNRPNGRRAGLREFRAALGALRREPSAATTKANGEGAPFPRQEELETKRVRLTWYARMLGDDEFPEPVLPAAHRSIAEDARGAKRLNELAWFYVDPRAPQCGFESTGLGLAQAAVNRLLGPVRPRRPLLVERPEDFAVPMEPGATGRPFSVDRYAPYDAMSYLRKCRDTYAWALYRTRRFDEARLQERLALAAADLTLVADLDAEITRWHNGAAARERTRLAAEVVTLGEEAAVWQAVRDRDMAHVLWYEQLAEIVSVMDALASRLGSNERTLGAEVRAPTWEDAIAAIAALADYRGLRLSRQVDLVPLGPDPNSGLWEFAHTGSGERVTRGGDGFLRLAEDSGIVFVLLPACEAWVRDGQDWEPMARVDIGAFFIGKYEVTRAQWRALAGSWHEDLGARMSLPVASVSHDDCLAALGRAAGWLTLPTQAQWAYACWGTRSPVGWGIVPSAADLRMPGVPLCSVVVTQANERGIHGMLTNAKERCLDGPTPGYPLRTGDGKRLWHGWLNTFGAFGGPWSASAGNHQWDDIAMRSDRVSNVGLRVARPVMR